jgi:hypothetical protein
MSSSVLPVRGWPQRAGVGNDQDASLRDDCHAQLVWRTAHRVALLWASIRVPSHGVPPRQAAAEAELSPLSEFTAIFHGDNKIVISDGNVKARTVHGHPKGPLAI